MKRKVGLFLFVVMLAVTLGAAAVVSFTMYKLVAARQSRDIQSIERSLSQRFTIFEVMLRSQYDRIRAHMVEVLPLIAADIESMGAAPDRLSRKQLDALTRKYKVEDIYFIDRSHQIFQTNLASELGLKFQPSEFTRFLDAVYGKGEVMNAGIDFADRTGALNVYIYFSPRGKNYIIETSTEIQPSLAKGDFGWMSKYFFKDLFSDAVANNDYVNDVDIYLVNATAAWSLIHTGEKLNPEITDRVIKSGRFEELDSSGNQLTVYSPDAAGVKNTMNDPVINSLIIRKLSYDIGLARQVVVNVLIVSVVVLALAFPVVFWIASRLLQRQMLNPLFKLQAEARAIADGDLEHAVADTERRDEIGNLASSFATMRDAVRRTIGDLRETNTAIERFVPHAFLAIMGKPSIVSVRLGDNKRLNMTILFSDIRNFTGLSERMTPDENFAFINAYLERMGPVIRDHNGFIDKYIGDAIMALFEQSDDALRAGLAMIDTLARYNAERQAAGLPEIGCGIGLNTGSLMLGTIGEKDRMDGTVISDAVNLAARIESLTKTYGSKLLISQYTYEQLADAKAHDIRPIDVAIVKGKTKPVTILEVFDRNEPSLRLLKAQTQHLLHSGVEALLRHDLPQARQLFGQCLALFPGDPAAINLSKRCA